MNDQGLIGKIFRFAALALIIIFFLIWAPGFGTRLNWLDTSTYGTTTLFLALAELPIIISAGIDLSVGAILGVGSSITAIIYQHLGTGDVALICALLASLGAGFLFGAVNATCITVLRLSPFITTLATLTAGTGVVYLLTNDAILSITGNISTFGDIVWLNWIPIEVAIGVALAIVVAFFLRFTRSGMRIYAIGGNVESARRSGVRVTSYLVRLYIVAGLISALAGFLQAAQLGEATPTSGQNDELMAIAAVIIGGASLFGGRGDVLGTFIGSAIVSVLVTGLVLFGANPSWQVIAVGIVIVASVFIQQASAATREARRRARGRFDVIRAERAARQ